jgi:predicted RNase H-like nuclease
MAPVAGVDGCRGGWVVVTETDAFVCADFAAVLAALPDDAVIAVDMPIGLLDEFAPGGREADRAARRALPAKASSVFSAPPRRAFGARNLREAQDRGCRMTIQAFNILPKVENVDRSMTPALQARVREVHPELCFHTMNGGRGLGAGKKSRAGREARGALLRRVGIEVPSRLVGTAPDDLLDAGAALWGARRVATGTAARVPEEVPLDPHGLRMEIWW